MTSYIQSSSVEAGRSTERKPQMAGIMVFGRNRDLLYVNERGREVLLRLGRREPGRPCNGALPKAIAAVLDDVLASTEPAVDDRGWRRFPTKPLGEAAGRVLCAQAFAQPRDADTARPVIVLTIHGGEDSG